MGETCHPICRKYTVRSRFVPGDRKSETNKPLKSGDKFVPGICLCGKYGDKRIGGTDRNENFVPVCPQNRKIGDKMDPLKTPVKWGFSDCLSPPSKYGDKWKMPEMPILSGFLSFCPQICPQKKKKSGDRKIRYPMGFFPAGTNLGTNSFKPL